MALTLLRGTTAGAATTLTVSDPPALRRQPVRQRPGVRAVRDRDAGLAPADDADPRAGQGTGHHRRDHRRRRQRHPDPHQAEIRPSGTNDSAAASSGSRPTAPSTPSPTASTRLGRPGFHQLRQFHPEHRLLGRRHHPLRRRRSGHLAVQDHRRPGRLDQRQSDRPQRPAGPRRPLRRPGSAVAVVDTGVDARRPRSAAASPGARTSSPAAWATRTWPAGRVDQHRRPVAPAAPAAAAAVGGGGGGQAECTAINAVLSNHDRRARHAGRRRRRPVRPPRDHRSRSTSSVRSPRPRRSRRAAARVRAPAEPAAAAAAAAAAEPAAPAGGAVVTNDNGATTRPSHGLQYIVQHPFVNDPIRPGQGRSRDRRRLCLRHAASPSRPRPRPTSSIPQVVIALKNEYHKLRKEGIANIAATGEFGAAPRGSPTSALGTTTGGTGGHDHDDRVTQAANNAQNTAVGDNQGHLAARRHQRGDLGHRRLLLPLHARHPRPRRSTPHRRHPAARSARSCSSARA